VGRFTITETQSNDSYRFLAWLICGVGACFYCYEYFLRIAPSVMTADLMRFFHLSAGQYGDLIAFFYYAYTPMQLVVGVLMDRYGPRRLLTLACLCCTIGAFLFASTPYVVVAGLGRFLIGFGAAFAFVGALKLATIWLPPERFAAISGMVTALGMLGAMVGDVVMAELVELRGWRFTILMSVWIGAILIVLILLIVRDRVKTTRQSAVTFVPELGFYDVFVGLVQSLKNPQIWINGLIGCLMYLPISAFAELWGIPYLIQTHHVSHVEAASIVSMIFFGFAVGGPLWGMISDFVKLRRLPLIMGSIVSLVLICIILYVPNLSSGLLHILFFCFGMTASVEIIVFAVGREVSQKHIAGTAISLTNTFVMLGGALFQPIIGVLLDLHWGGQLGAGGVHVYTVHTYQMALSILPLGLVAAVIFGFLLRETRCRLTS